MLDKQEHVSITKAQLNAYNDELEESQGGGRNSKRRNHSVSFRWSEFIKTFIYEALGIFSLPLLLLLDGKYAAINRSFLPGTFSRVFVTSNILHVCLILSNMMYMMMRDSMENVSKFEVFLVNILMLERVIIISIKYGFFPKYTMSEIKSRKISVKDLSDSLILSGWINFPCSVIDEAIYATQDRLQMDLENIEFDCIPTYECQHLKQCQISGRCLFGKLWENSQRANIKYIQHGQKSYKFMAYITAFCGFVGRLLYGKPLMGSNIFEGFVISSVMIGLTAFSLANFGFLWTASVDLRRRLYVFEFWTLMLDGQLEIENDEITEEDTTNDWNFSIFLDKSEQFSKHDSEVETVETDSDHDKLEKSEPVSKFDSCMQDERTNLTKPINTNQIYANDTTKSRFRFKVQQINFRDFQAVFHWYRMVLATKDFGQRYFKRLQAYSSFFLLAVLLSAIVVLSVVTLRYSDVEEQTVGQLDSILGFSLDLTDLDVWVGSYIIFLSIFMLAKISIIVFYGQQINNEFDEYERLLSINKTNIVFVSGALSKASKNQTMQMQMGMNNNGINMGMGLGMNSMNSMNSNYTKTKPYMRKSNTLSPFLQRTVSSANPNDDAKQTHVESIKNNSNTRTFDSDRTSKDSINNSISKNKESSLANAVNMCALYCNDEKMMTTFFDINTLHEMTTAEKMIDSVVELLLIEAKNNPIRILGIRADAGILALIMSGVSSIAVFFLQLITGIGN